MARKAQDIKQTMCLSMCKHAKDIRKEQMQVLDDKNIPKCSLI